MRALLPLLALSLAGCGAPIRGYWDLVLWQVRRDGERLERRDAGWLMFQEDSTRGFGMLLRYDYDPVAFDLLPTTTPGEVRGGYDVSGYEYDKEEPEIDLRYEQGDYLTTLYFDVVELRNAEMVLETAEPAVDGSQWRWELQR